MADIKTGADGGAGVCVFELTRMEINMRIGHGIDHGSGGKLIISVQRHKHLTHALSRRDVGARQRADIEIPPPLVFKAGQARMFAKDIRRALVVKGVGKPMRRATAEMIHQSVRASPGGLRNTLCLERQLLFDYAEVVSRQCTASAARIDSMYVA